MNQRVYITEANTNQKTAKGEFKVKVDGKLKFHSKETVISTGNATLAPSIEAKQKGTTAVISFPAGLPIGMENTVVYDKDFRGGSAAYAVWGLFSQEDLIEAEPRSGEAVLHITIDKEMKSLKGHFSFPTWSTPQQTVEGEFNLKYED